MPEISRFLGIAIRMYYRDELAENWELARQEQPLNRIDPLE
ncbi:hypothetical protein [Stieleria varia]|nr:hypothetical protein [Stieleria varia]